MKINLKKNFLIVLGLFAGIVLLLVGKAYFTDNSDKVILNIDGREYKLFTARTTLEKIRGLSGISKLDRADGMIFYFEPKQKVAFWNKNTHLDLELVWMSDGKIIGRDFLPKEDGNGLIIKNSPDEVSQVVELVK